MPHGRRNRLIDTETVLSTTEAGVVRVVPEGTAMCVASARYRGGRL